LNTNQEQVEGKLKEEIIVEEYTADFYLKQLQQRKLPLIVSVWNAIRPYQLSDLQGKV
jgi:hypothetical protein